MKEHIIPRSVLANFVGIDRFIKAAEGALNQAAETTGFPPYNLSKIGENDYRIEIAVAGFAQEELSVETKEKVLLITGKQQNKPEGDFIHRGIANRAFERTFQLADFVEVSTASLKNGILSIELKRLVPESQKQRKIDIGTADAVRSEAPAAEPATETVTV